MTQKCGFDLLDPVFRETIALPQTQRALGTIQDEYGSEPLPDDMNVCRPMIVGIDYDAQAPQSQDGRHGSRILLTGAVGITWDGVSFAFILDVLIY